MEVMRKLLIAWHCITILVSGRQVVMLTPLVSAIVICAAVASTTTTPCPEKKCPEHYRLSLELGIFSFNNFCYDYFWHNWPSNDHLVCHPTQCLLLHYLGKTKLMKCELK